ncbi:hypothetical protein V8F20_012325 [Naviculisporaceae sp. PSN 640]
MSSSSETVRPSPDPETSSSETVRPSPDPETSSSGTLVPSPDPETSSSGTLVPSPDPETSSSGSLMPSPHREMSASDTEIPSSDARMYTWQDVLTLHDANEICNEVRERKWSWEKVLQELGALPPIACTSTAIIVELEFEDSDSEHLDILDLPITWRVHGLDTVEALKILWSLDLDKLYDTVNFRALGYEKNEEVARDGTQLITLTPRQYPSCNGGPGFFNNTGWMHPGRRLIVANF